MTDARLTARFFIPSKTGRPGSWFCAGVIFFLGLLAGALPVQSARETAGGGQTDLKAVLSAAGSVVSIQVDTGGMAAGPPQAAFDKSTGMILIARRVIGAQSEKTGAGVVIDSSGLIATNAHTVAQAGRITVTFYNKQTASASIVKIFPEEDLAFLGVTPPYPLPALRFADSEHAVFRMPVYVLANSPMIRGSLSECTVIGLVKGKDGSSNALLRLNIGLYKGDSGSPVLTQNGKLIGLLSAGQTRIPSAFAIASNVIAKHYLECLAERMKGYPTPAES